MSENWTKGPWIVRDERIVGADGQTIRMSGVALPCGYVPKNDESFSNMNLAAAAPEMYEVITALLEYIDAIPPDVAASLPTMPGVSRDWVESVGAKARGES